MPTNRSTTTSQNVNYGLVAPVRSTDIAVYNAY